MHIGEDGTTAWSREGRAVRRVRPEALTGVCVPEPFDRLEAACVAAVELLSVTGAAVTSVSRPDEPGAAVTTVHATHEAIRRFQDLQHAAGQGPSLDAARLGRAVHAPALAAAAPGCWPGLVDAAGDAGVAAVFSFPLRLDGAVVGTLDLHRDCCGELTATQTADAELWAAVVLREVAAVHASTPPARLRARSGALSVERALIEQATGMVAVQLGAPMSEALGRLRAYAHARRRQLADLAHDVVDGAVRLG